MFAQDNKQPSAKDAPGPKPSVKLYSIFALQRDKAFTGEFETSKSKYKFTFAPKSAQVENGKLRLTGTFSVGARKVENVVATLASIQGGLGTVPTAINERPLKSSSGLPLTEATDIRGFVGAMYFHLSPIKAAALGLTIDMSKVQLNARLFPTSETERELQVVFSDVASALYGATPNANAAAPHLAALNQIF
ncbi:MAG: hypothetical protein JST84_00865 [Acidobacteria bacterium]|nr:hypothetical protein [Acidobacteriota bacterium]